MKITLSIPGYPHKIAIDSHAKSTEVLGLSQYEKLAKVYIEAHKKDIIRRVDVLVLYVDSFRKIFIKNLNSINSDIARCILTTDSAVKNTKSYLNEYLHSIKDGFKEAANDTIAVKQEYVDLVEIDLEDYDRHYDDEFDHTNDALIKTVKDLYGIGRAFGDPYIISSWSDKDYEKTYNEFRSLSNVKNRYLVDISRYQNDIHAELSIINFFKLGE
jgi:hypothetical protein